MKTRHLATLQFESTDNYDNNLTTLIELIEQTPDNAIVLAPEVCLTNFDYAHFEAASAFSAKAIDQLLRLSKERIIALSVIEKRENGKFYNVAKVLHGEKVVHQQCKNRLFKLGDEHKYFSQGKDEHLSLFTIEGITFGLMICFELRFKQFWQKLEGADIMLIPAQWGKLRSQNFVSLTNALAIMNQCYVVASDADNSDTSGMSGIITPFGEERRNGALVCLEGNFSEKEVRKMRRYLDVGIA